MILIHPAVPGFGFRHVETVLHEGSRLEIPFPKDLGVFAAPGEVHEAVGVLGRQAGGAFPHPVLFFFFRQGVEVHEHIPAGLGFSVFRERRAPPEAADVFLILPEVVDLTSEETARGQAILREQDFSHFFFNGRVLGVFVEHRQGLLVALLHPLQRLGAFHVFKPEVRVRGGRGARSKGKESGAQEIFHLPIEPRRVRKSTTKLATARDGGSMSTCMGVSTTSSMSER